MKKTCLLKIFKLTAYWGLVLTSSALILSVITFYSAFDYFDDYGWKDLLKYEHQYLYRTFKVLFLLSGLFALPAFFINLIVYRISVGRSIVKALIVNLVFLVLYSVFLDESGILMKNTAYFQALPVYGIMMIIGAILLKSRRTGIVA